MKRSFHILLIFTLLLSVVHAKTETMAERKQRIERKYLQERAELVQGDAEVPAEMAVGDEEVLDSEKFKEPQVNLQRQEPGAVMPPPRRPRPRPRKEAANWLLEVEDTESTDPYANPYAWDATTEDDTKKKPARATTEQLRRDAYSAETRRGSWFTRRTDSTGQGSFDNTQQGSSFGTTRGTSPYSTVEGRGLFGQREQDRQTTPSLFGNAAGSSRTKPFGVDTRQEDPFKTKFSRRSGTTRRSDATTEARRNGYTPYKSPFQSQTQRSAQQPWGATTSDNQEFQKKNTFEAWKKKSPQQLDPTRDDAFIDGLMPKVHH